MYVDRPAADAVVDVVLVRPRCDEDHELVTAAAAARFVLCAPHCRVASDAVAAVPLLVAVGDSKRGKRNAY